MKRTFTFFFKSVYMFKSPANKFLSHKCRNRKKIQKYKIIFSNLIKNLFPANEFVLQKCRKIGIMQKHIKEISLKKI